MPHKREKDQVKWEGVITNIQGNILTHLARYKFLTISQLLDLDVGTSQYKYLWKQIASLRDRKTPLVKCQRFSVTAPPQGKPPQRIEDWYYLSNAGKKALINELRFENEIKMPIGRGNLAYKDYRHRRRTIDFQIALERWAISIGMEIPFFDRYFDKLGNNRTDKNLRAKTRIDFKEKDFFIPDGAFKIANDQLEKFFLLEIYNGKDTNRTINQLHKHATALTKRYTHQAYNLPKNKSYNIVLIFQNESLQNAVVERVNNQEKAFSIIQKYFRCKSLNQLKEGDFNSEWITLSGENNNLI